MSWLSSWFNNPADPLQHPSLDEDGRWQTAAGPRLVIYTGAGLSAESGLATFRNQGGLWDQHDVNQVCHGATWRDHRALVEEFYATRQAHNHQARPHDGHAWCAEMEAQGAVLVTQNVDTLLERAGAKHVIHLHGQLDQRQCFSCGAHWKSVVSPVRCAYCRSDDTRVDVVFFGEHAPRYAQASSVLGGLRASDTLMIVGTEASVANPLRWLTQPCTVVVVDPDPSPRLLVAPKVVAVAQPASRLREIWAGLTR